MEKKTIVEECISAWERQHPLAAKLNGLTGLIATVIGGLVLASVIGILVMYRDVGVLVSEVKSLSTRVETISQRLEQHRVIHEQRNRERLANEQGKTE